jgi:hypothetical protein
MLRPSLWILAVALAGVLLPGCARTDREAEQARSDLAKVEEYLKEKHPGKTWQAGPARIDTEEVRAAYGQRRFYYVFSPPPVLPRGGAPPGAQVLEEFRKARTQFEKEKVSLTVALDAQGRVTAYQKAEDFSSGLLEFSSEADTRTAAAAVLSLFEADELGPRVVAAKDVTVHKDPKGRWQAGVVVGAAGKGGWTGTVHFDRDGKCTAVARAPLVVNVP